MGRNAAGVKGASLRGDDKVVDLITGSEDQMLLLVCENGYGKRTPIGEFRLTKRGSQGVVGIKANERNGRVVNARNASRCDEVIFSTNGGMLVRTKVDQISIQGLTPAGGHETRRAGDDRMHGP